MARTLRSMGRRDEAREYYQKTIDRHPGSVYAKEAEEALKGL